MGAVIVPPFKLAASDSIEPRSSAVTKIFGNSAFSMSVGGTSASTAQLDVLPSTSSTIGMIIKGAASQSADYFQVLNSSGTVHWKINSDPRVIFTPSSRTISTTNYYLFDSGGVTHTIDHAIGLGIVRSADTYNFTVSQAGITGQLFFYHGNTYKNDPSVTGALCGLFSVGFYNNPAFIGDTHATTMGAVVFPSGSFHDVASFSILNSGTLTADDWTGFLSSPLSSTGVTLTNRKGMWIKNCLNGTITNHYGILIDDLANAGSTTTQALRVLGTTAHSRHVPKIKIGTDSAPNVDCDVNGWINYAGAVRVSTQFDKTNTTLANVTGLSVTTVSGRTYRFRAVLFLASSAVGGYKLAIAGTNTATAIIYNINVLNNATNAYTITSQQTALAGSAGAAVGTSEYAEISGLITVNAGGTLTVQFAQNVSNGTSSVLVGSTFTVWDVV